MAPGPPGGSCIRHPNQPHPGGFVDVGGGADAAAVATAVAPAGKGAKSSMRGIFWTYVAPAARRLQGMVPPERIELSTPPLPRACSTPELRRHGMRRAPCHRGAIGATGMGRARSGDRSRGNFTVRRPDRARPPLTRRCHRFTMRAVDFAGREGRFRDGGGQGRTPARGHRRAEARRSQACPPGGGAAGEPAAAKATGPVAQPASRAI